MSVSEDAAITQPLRMLVVTERSPGSAMSAASTITRYILAAVMSGTLLIMMYLPAVIIMGIIISGLLEIVFASLSIMTGK